MKKGIYCIECLVNNKKYIGKSVDINSRIAHHKSYLKKNTHKNIFLQNAFNKYGVENFSFYVLEEIDGSKMDSQEVYYISKFNTTNDKFGYNLQSGGEVGFSHNEKTKNYVRSQRACKKVYMFTQDGYLIKVYDSISNCAISLNVSPCDVRRTISQKQRLCKGFVLNDENVFRLRESKRSLNYKNLFSNKSKL